MHVEDLETAIPVLMLTSFYLLSKSNIKHNL